MINLNNLLGLFNFSRSIKLILIGIAILLIILACIKYKNGRIFVFTFLGVGLISFAIYAGLYINRYYNTSGGIYGQISKIYKPNQVKITDSVKYSFSNVVLTQELENRYSAKIISNDVLDLVLNENVTYGIYVNGIPCKNCEINTNYIIAKYEYVFYDEDFNIAKQDILTLKFAFYNNSTMLVVSTDGGATAVKYWNYYFNKNLFEVTIDNKGFDYSAKNDIPSAEAIYNRPLTINFGEESIDNENLKFSVSVDGTVYKDVHSWSGFVAMDSMVLILDLDGPQFYDVNTYNCEEVTINSFIFTNFKDLKNNSITLRYCLAI